MKFRIHPFWELDFEPTDDPDVLVANANTMFPVYLFRCPACDEWATELHEGRGELSVCDRCAEHYGNVWHFARSGRYLTWLNPPNPTSKPTRARIAASLRTEIYVRDGYRCRYCGGFESGLALDHVIPWSKGGEDTAENLVTACRDCNLSKQDRTPEEAGMALRNLP